MWAQSPIPKERHCPTWTRAKKSATLRSGGGRPFDYAVREKALIAIAVVDLFAAPIFRFFVMAAPGL